MTKLTMQAGGYMSFHDSSDGSSPSSDYQGFDDYQNGCSCGNTWAPKSVQGQRSVFFVR
jgi:hypothetical protein